MTLEFGYIQRYDNKGFGFVSKELSPRHSKETYFHIKTIKRKYAQLGQTIDNGGWRGVSFWYVTEHTHKGEAVSEIWVTATELPKDLQNQLMSLLESYWSSLSPTLPNWLERVTLDLAGEAKLTSWKDTRNRRIFEQRQAEQRRREEERKKAEETRLARLELERIAEEERKKREAEKLARLRAEQELIAAQERAKIKDFCNLRGITTVVHFTRIENLSSILTYGLFGRKTLDSKGIKYIFNDDQRIDGHRDAICVSISFPNYRMFYRYRQNVPQKWVVLLLDASLLWELECAFCRENAASNTVTRVPLQERKKFSALQLMFADLPHISRQVLNLPDNYPTNPQAEVLVFEPVTVKYIKAVHFEQNSTELLTSLSRINSSVELVCNTRYFAPRLDYSFWSSQWPNDLIVFDSLDGDKSFWNVFYG